MRFQFINIAFKAWCLLYTNQTACQTKTAMKISRKQKIRMIKEKKLDYSKQSMPAHSKKLCVNSLLVKSEHNSCQCPYSQCCCCSHAAPCLYTRTSLKWDESLVETSCEEEFKRIQKESAFKAWVWPQPWDLPHSGQNRSFIMMLSVSDVGSVFRHHHMTCWSLIGHFEPLKQ